MEAALRRQVPDLIQDLYSKPYEFELSQALKVFEYLFPDSPEMGEPKSIGQEKIIFKSRISMSTPSSDIYKTYDVPSGNVVMVVNLMGIAGIQGPLPTPYSEWILDRVSKKDNAFADFLDIFNHRLITLKTKISKHYVPTLSKKLPPDTELGNTILSLTGLENYQESIQVKPRNMLKYAGLMWHNACSAAGFKSLISDYFQVKTSIYQLEGRWVYLQAEDQTLLGQQNTVLGLNSSIGTKFWSGDTLFKLTLGSMNGFMFRQFLKTGKAYNELINIAKEYLPQGQKFYMNLVIDKDDVTPTKLDGKSALGWTSWAISNKPLHNDAQVRIYPD